MPNPGEEISVKNFFQTLLEINERDPSKLETIIDGLRSFRSKEWNLILLLSYYSLLDPSNDPTDKARANDLRERIYNELLSRESNS